MLENTKYSIYFAFLFACLTLFFSFSKSKFIHMPWPGRCLLLTSPQHPGSSTEYEVAAFSMLSVGGAR